MMFKKILPFLFAIPAMAAAEQAYVVYDFTHNRPLEMKNPNHVKPIASVTKLMTANVFLENNRNPNCTAQITDADNDHIKGTGTKLPKYTPIACSELLKAMLVHSDNYAAHALSRSAGMSRSQFIQKMNQKARQLGMNSTHFTDSSGLSSQNVSSVMDLVKLARHSVNKPIIRDLSNTKATLIAVGNKRVFMQNTNVLVRDEHFEAGLNKTGYTREAGFNLVFINKYSCNKITLGVISLDNASSAMRSAFTENKLQQYGCVKFS